MVCTYVQSMDIGFGDFQYGGVRLQYILITLFIFLFFFCHYITGKTSVRIVMILAPSTETKEWIVKLYMEKERNVFMCGLRNDFYRVFAIVLYTMEVNRFWRSVFKNMLHEN